MTREYAGGEPCTRARGDLPAPTSILVTTESLARGRPSAVGVTPTSVAILRSDPRCIEAATSQQPTADEALASTVAGTDTR